MGGAVLLGSTGGAADEVSGARLAEGTRGLGAVLVDGEADGVAVNVTGGTCGVDEVLLVGFDGLVELLEGVGAREADGSGLVVFFLSVVI